MVGADSTFLGLLLHPEAKPTDDPTTGKPTTRIPDRIEKLLVDLDAARERIIVPTPSLCEFLILAGKDAPQYQGELHMLRAILVKPFDEIAATELVAMELLARGKGNKRSPAPQNTPWQKVKFDRQIVAVCKVHGVHTIYSDDGNLKAFAEDSGIKVVGCWELPLPPSNMPLLDTTTEPPIEF